METKNISSETWQLNFILFGGKLIDDKDLRFLIDQNTLTVEFPHPENRGYQKEKDAGILISVQTPEGKEKAFNVIYDQIRTEVRQKMAYYRAVETPAFVPMPDFNIDIRHEIHFICVNIPLGPKKENKPALSSILKSPIIQVNSPEYFDDPNFLYELCCLYDEMMDRFEKEKPISTSDDKCLYINQFIDVYFVGNLVLYEMFLEKYVQRQLNNNRQQLLEKLATDKYFLDKELIRFFKHVNNFSGKLLGAERISKADVLKNDLLRLQYSGRYLDDIEAFRQALLTMIDSYGELLKIDLEDIQKHFYWEKGKRQYKGGILMKGKITALVKMLFEYGFTFEDLWK